MTEDRKYQMQGWVIMLIGVAVIVAVTLLASCMTPKTAVDYLKKKDLLADTCAANFPIKEETDTVYEIQYRTDSALVNELLLINDQLKRRLEYIEGLPPVIDSAECQQLRRFYVSDVKYYKYKVSLLEQKIAYQHDSIIRITKTQQDSAALAFLRKTMQAELNKKDAKLAETEKKLQDEIAQSKRRGKTIFYLIAALVATIALGGYLAISKKKIPFIN